MLHGQPAATTTNAFSVSLDHPVTQHQRVLLFVAPPGSISEALAAAVEREFRWISVRMVSGPRQARSTFGATVQLILVDVTLLGEFMNHWHELERAHPAALTAVTASRRPAELGILRQAAENRAIRGVVPMDVNLDLWLSVIRIMLMGGEYFPPEFFPYDAIPGTAPLSGEPLHEHPITPAIKSLTRREIQVLSCISRGLQNKLIAAELGLSEHTVKIHIHNTIRKLGVHNRTEAAALFLRRADYDDSDGLRRISGIPG